MKPIATRLLLVFVSMVVLLSCAATVRGAEPAIGERLPMIVVGAIEKIQVSSEGFLEERFVMPGMVSMRLNDLAEGESLRLADWPVSPGDHRTISVKRRSIYAPGARILEIGEHGARELPRSEHRYFVGEIDDEPGSGVLVILDPVNGRLTGLAMSDGQTFDLAPVPGGSPTEVRVVATHERMAGLDPHWGCGGEELDNPRSPTDRGVGLKNNGATKSGGPLDAILAVDTDTELLNQKFGGSTTAATNYIADLIAAMNVMYSRDLDVTLVQGTTFLRTSSDPYTANSGSSASPTELYEFRDYWSSTYGSVQRALTALLSGKSPSSNSASGIAFIGGLCSTGSGYSFSKVFKVDYLSGDAKLVGHEIGHNFGSQHTHCYSPPIDQCYGQESGCYSGTTSCPGGPGTVMSYCHVTGCGSTLNFHPTVINNILTNHVAPATGVCIFPATSADQIFADGFESSDTTRWSSTTP